MPSALENEIFISPLADKMGPRSGTCYLAHSYQSVHVTPSILLSRGLYAETIDKSVSILVSEASKVSRGGSDKRRLGGCCQNSPLFVTAVLEEILPDLDPVLVMTVNPGFGHQHFIDNTLAKIERVRRMIEHANLPSEAEVAGGVDEKTAALAASAGADLG